MSLSADDRMAILDLAARYNHAIDLGNPDAWADTFTDDGIFEVKGRPPTVGRAALVEFCKQSNSRGLNSRHWNTNPVVDGSGDSASLQVYLQLVRQTDQGHQVQVSGIYRDQLKKVSGAWKFAHRTLTVDTP